jgi:hypothetical protein
MKKHIKVMVSLLVVMIVVVGQSMVPCYVSGQVKKLTQQEMFGNYKPVSVDADKTFGPKAGKQIKVFVLSGQSNMGGHGASKDLDPALQQGNDRILMFEDGKWQPLRPLKRTFGPEIAFALTMAKAWPNETIGIVKQAKGGTGVLAWHPQWTKEQADRTGDAKKGNLWLELTNKVEPAITAVDCELKGFVWMQGGADMRNEELGKEYLQNLSALVLGLRQEFKVPNLPFVLGSYRDGGAPEDLSGMKEQVLKMGGRKKGSYYVLQAQYEAEQELKPANMVPLRDLQRWPKNVHYDTRGHMDLGRLLAEGYLELTSSSNK